MRFYRILNLLSIDVALGAVISAAMFGRILHVAILPQGFLILGLSVWLIYTADHLLDAYSMRQVATSERHRFHQQHFLSVLIAFIAVGLVALSLMFMIRVQIITAGIFFGVLVVVYLLVSRWLTYFKELAGSILYTGGVLLPAWSLNTGRLTDYQLILIIIFSLIAFSNMLIFARFSMEEDIMNNQKSLATTLGIVPMNRLINLVFVISLCVMTYAAAIAITPELVLMFIMEMMLALIFLVEYFRHDNQYRLYGDAIFLLPSVLLIVPRLREATSLFLP